MDTTGNTGAGKTPPIFVVGRFRSGTTALWSALRTLPELHCFFEPLHDNLLEYIEAAAPPDPTHRGVDEYFAEYEACRTRLAALHRPEFGVSRLCLAEDEAH
ncbi:MAG: hypothetical protein VX574_04130, partial [Myxococcota bacterium]|nr:hypothetical protein [Myxococcota bacterium]